MPRKQLILTERFIPDSSISCSQSEMLMLDMNEKQSPLTVRAMIYALPGIIQTHIATCGKKHSCLNLASVLVEANQLQPL